MSRTSKFTSTKRARKHEDRPSVAIIGGGFSGTACAVHLARASTVPLRIEIIEPRPTLGGGVAYGAAGPEHRINVPSDRMTVFAERPQDFSEWLDQNQLRDADPEGWTAGGHFYARRQVFGEYVADLAERAAADNPSGSTLTHIKGHASDLAHIPEGLSITIAPDGESRTFSAAIVAASHASPSFKWRLLDGAAELPRLHLDPWRAKEIAAIADDARVLILGTGLTMADVVVTLREHGHKGDILAVSRRGLLPRTHAEFDNSLDFLDGETLPATALSVLRMTRRKIAEAESAGLSWRAALDALRRALPVVWAALPLPQRRNALRFLRAFWDVHRYRMSPQVAELLARGTESGWLKIGAGKVRSIGREADQFRVAWTPRGGKARAECFDAVVNCTGPDSDLARSDNPLFRSLFEKGTARPDPLGLGVEVDAEARVLSLSGAPDPMLRVAGPLARGHFGELMGLPEVSAHARFVAEGLAAELSKGE